MDNNPPRKVITQVVIAISGSQRGYVIVLVLDGFARATFHSQNNEEASLEPIPALQASGYWQPQEQRGTAAGRLLTVVVEELLDQVNVCEHHPPAAVSLQPQLVQGVTLVKVCLQQAEICLPLVSDHLPAREASHRDDHGYPCLWRLRATFF